MNVGSQNGVRPFNRLREEMEHLFQGAFDEAPWGGRLFPTLNMWEDEHHLYVEAELPGLDMKDVEVQVSGDELTIRGERPAGNADKTAYHRRERGTGSFGRAVRLPIDIDADKVRAALRDGVLLVTLPKAEAVKPRKIEVRGQ